MNLNLDLKLYFGGVLRCVAVLQAFFSFLRGIIASLVDKKCSKKENKLCQEHESSCLNTMNGHEWQYPPISRTFKPLFDRHLEMSRLVLELVSRKIGDT